MNHKIISFQLCTELLEKLMKYGAKRGLNLSSTLRFILNSFFHDIEEDKNNNVK